MNERERYSCLPAGPAPRVISVLFAPAVPSQSPTILTRPGVLTKELKNSHFEPSAFPLSGIPHSSHQFSEKR